MSSTEEIKMLRDVFNSWEELLASMSEEEITAHDLPSNWSVKDVVAHLWGWQQRSVARMEAALHDKAPEYPRWPERLDPDLEEDLDQTNDWIYQTYRDRKWPDVYAGWKAQFLRLLQLAEQVPEQDLLEPGRYEWMGEYPLAESLQGSYEHHAEHLEELLLARSSRNGDIKA